MDVGTGEFMSETAIKERQPDETKREYFAYGEIVQVKRGFFEVCKIDERRNRITLKGVPPPNPEEMTQYRVACAGDPQSVAARLARAVGDGG